MIRGSTQLSKNTYDFSLMWCANYTDNTDNTDNTIIRIMWVGWGCLDHGPWKRYIKEKRDSEQIVCKVLKILR